MTTGVLPFETLKRKLQINTGFFETNQLIENAQMSVNAGNFDGAGMSVGNLQFNFGQADRLQEYFKFLIDNHPTVVSTAFGANTDEHTEFLNVINTYTRTARVTWANGITDYVVNSEGRILKQPWKDIFSALAVTSQAISKYNSMADTYYFPNPYDLFRQMTCTSRMALASLYDVYVNKGRYYPINLLQNDFDAIDANEAIDEIEKEAQKIYQINFRGNEEENALDDERSLEFDDRRLAMGNQGGDYFGDMYIPDANFDMNQEPAIAEKVNSLGVKLGTLDIQNAFLGTVPIQGIYLGAILLGSTAEPYTTSKVPQTQFRTNPDFYQGLLTSEVTLEANQPLWVDVQNFVACRTYYTINGSTPTTGSTLYTEALKFTQSCTLKTLTVSVSGIAEAVKTLTVTIPSAQSWRYLKVEGYGTSTDDTTRMVEVEAWEGATNVLATSTMLSYQSPLNGGSILDGEGDSRVTDGIKTTTSGTYPIWWSTVPNGNVVFDLGAQKTLTKLNYYGHSTTGAERANQFRILASNTNNGSDWAELWNMSANTDIQPNLPAGYELLL